MCNGKRYHSGVFVGVLVGVFVGVSVGVFVGVLVGVLVGVFVDPEILRAKTGEWLMVLADGPGCSDRVQKLYVATSNDGLTWSTPQKISGSDLRRLDPTGYEVSTNVFRIYYATAVAGALGDVTYTIKRGTIAIKQSSAEVAITGGKKATTKTTITCVKGKTTKKVTGADRNCNC